MRFTKVKKKKQLALHDNVRNGGAPNCNRTCSQKYDRTCARSVTFSNTFLSLSLSLYLYLPLFYWLSYSAGKVVKRIFGEERTQSCTCAPIVPRYRRPAYCGLNCRDRYLNFTRQRLTRLLHNDPIIGISNCCVRSTEKMKIIVLRLINPFAIYPYNECVV